MTDAQYDILIVGGGHGGAQAAIALRQRGFDGTLAIVGDEPEMPYERPPLSKEYLAQKKGFERILIRPTPFWAERGVDVLLDRRVDAVDPNGRSVATHRGESIGYGRLIWAEVCATGPNVRTMEVGDQVLFSPEDRYEVEVRGDDYIILRERDIHAVASARIESTSGLYL